MGLEGIKKNFSDYFHPETLWKQGKLGKAEAVGAVISWATLVIYNGDWLGNFNIASSFKS